MMGAEYVGENPIPADILQQAQETYQRNKAAVDARYRQSGMEPPDTRREDGEAIVRYTNGSFPMKGLLSGSTWCSAKNLRKPPGFRGPPYTDYVCTATVRILRAPESQLESAAAMVDWEHAGGKIDEAYKQAWIARNDQQSQAVIAEIKRRSQIAMDNSQAMFNASMAAQNASHQQFMISQIANQRLHEEFLGTLQRGTNMSMARAGQAMQAQSTATSNLVDSILNQQTVRDPNTGQTSKVSSAYNYTWVDSTGKVGYQTSDGLANPNGVLPGTWTRQQVVNGDGTPR
jgi:hypothetical protein